MLPNLQDRLTDGLNRLGLNLTNIQQTQLLSYLDLLSQWNKTYNLTAIRDKSDMLAAHVLDSLTAQPFLFGDRFIDLGTGAGLPGIPLAIANPHKQFVLLDSLQKRTRFLLQVTHELQLSNVSVVCNRIEKYQPDQLFDTLLARALAKCAPLVADSCHLCKPGGRWVLLKGHDPSNECQYLPEDTRLLSIDPVKVPGLDQIRHIVIVEKERL